MNKRATWSIPITVLSVHKKGRTVTVPAKGGKYLVVGFEDIRVSLPKDCFAVAVQEAIDCVDESLYDSIYCNDLIVQPQSEHKNLKDTIVESESQTNFLDDADFSDKVAHKSGTQDSSAQNSISSLVLDAKQSQHSLDNSIVACKGDRLSAYDLADNK